MSGLAQVFLTDHELDLLIDWFDVRHTRDIIPQTSDAAEGDIPRESAQLYTKLVGIRRTLRCGCEGGVCDAPGL